MAILAFLAVLPACTSAGRLPVWEREGPNQTLQTLQTTSSTAAAASAYNKGMERWGQRDDKAALLEAISTWEEALSLAPEHGPTLVALARAHYFLGDAFISVDESIPQERESEVYEKGVTYAERGLLALEPEFAKSIEQAKGLDEALTKIGPAGVAAAYWYAANLGRFAAVLGVRTRAFHRDRIKRVIKAVRKIKPGFYHGGADRYLGAYFAELPTPEGKDLTVSQEHFQAAVDLAPEFLPNKVDQARFLAIELSDEKLFKKLLSEVINAPDGKDPDMAPENRAAKRQAKLMLDRINDVF